MKRFLICIGSLLILSPGTTGTSGGGFVYPRSVAVDGKGTIYVADKDAHAVFRIANGKPAVVVKGAGKPRTPLYHISGVAVSGTGEIAVSDVATFNVYRIVGGKPVPVADERTSPFSKPQSLTYDLQGDLIVPDLGEAAVFRVKGNRISKIASVPAPFATAVDKQGGILVLSASQRHLMKLDDQGKASTIFRGAPFEFPTDVAVGPAGDNLVVDGYARALFRIGSDGKVTTVAKGDPFRHPDSVAVEANGNLLIVDPHAKALFRVTPQGKVSVVHRGP